MHEPAGGPRRQAGYRLPLVAVERQRDRDRPRDGAGRAAHRIGHYPGFPAPLPQAEPAAASGLPHQRTVSP
jgi:hypothetical protein